MPLIVISQPVNFTYFGIGTHADPYILESINHYGNSASEIAFFVTEDGVITPDLTISSEENYDFGILINNDNYIVGSGSDTFTDPFAVFVGDIIRVQFTKNDLYSSGLDNISGTISFKKNLKYGSISRLFIAGGDNQHINLFLKNDGIEAIAELFVKSLTRRRLNLNIKNNIYNKLDLIIRGLENESIGKQLYLNGKIQNNLFINIKSNIKNSMDIYIASYEKFQDSLNINLKSETQDSMSMFVLNIPKPLLLDQFNLNIYGSTNKEIANSVNLYVLNKTIQGIPFFVLVDSIGRISNLLSIQIDGDTLINRANKKVDLFINNNYSPCFNYIDITTIGSGFLFNAVPQNKSVNLYIERDFNGFWNNMPMAINGNINYHSNVELITKAKTVDNTAFNLSISETKELISKDLHLYIHGFQEG